MIKKILLTIFYCWCLSSNIFSQQSEKFFTIKHPDNNTDIRVGYLEHLPDDYSFTDKNYPLIIFLHGLSEVGDGRFELHKVATNGTPEQIKNNKFPKSFKINGLEHKFIVISPQLNRAYSNNYWNKNYIDAVFEYVKKNYRIDPSRVYLTGLSLGGGGVWEYAGSNSDVANALAAIAPVCGATGKNTYAAGIIAKNRLPVWAFHGEKDKTVSLETSEFWVSSINNITPELAKLTKYPNVGHDSWTKAYHLEYNQTGQDSINNLYTWFLQNQRVELAIPSEPGTILPPSITANDEIKPYYNDYRYGSNMGYYNSNRTDIDIAKLVKNIGGHTIRPSLPHAFLESYGYNIRLSTFRDYAEKLDIKDITVFLEGPNESVREKKTYSNATSQSKVFENLYEPIWNNDGSVNQNNYYADYVHKTVSVYGNYVKFWEVWNEPDFTTNVAKKEEWLWRAPNPNELQNLQAPFYSYIRMLRITHEIVKKYAPDTYVCTGGIGYTQFLDALLRYSDNPDNGKITEEYPNTAGAYFDVLSFHYYPNYALKTWNNNLNDFDYFYYSDRAANRVMEEKNSFEKVLTDKGYNGDTYPKKIFIMTETGVARKTFDYRYGSNEMQRNFVVKTSVLAQKNNIKQTYFYTLGERADYSDPNNQDEFKLMGFYENLLRDNPGSEKKTEAGIAHLTTSSLLYGYKYDEAKTLELNLSTNIDGAAFSNNNETRYILWAKTTKNQSEAAEANFSFPSALNIKLFDKYDWNYALENKLTTVTAENIKLTGTPAIFLKSTATEPSLPTDPEEENPEEQNNTYEYAIYPNPTADKATLTVKSLVNGKGDYSIYKIDGTRIVENIPFLKNQEIFSIEVNMENYPSGIYLILLKAEGDNKLRVIKVIKKK